ncbi:PPE family protein, SVP subgroup [Mycobacterium simiae]|uniref:PE family protein n=2 Tax=Mycobacterium simiae TaxID=1784 RepID=A0A1X0YBV1_MYCSI|nr:PE domain-containing protein [Mycobacterium simiae]ORJ62597.1 PE family protein [Mycobacterium simiae]
MSFLTTVTEELLAAQGQLEAINANLAAQNAGAAAATTVVAPAALDPVSAQQAAIFSAYGTAYQTTAGEAQTQLETYTTNLGVSSTSYSDTEATNAAAATLSEGSQQMSLLSDPVSQIQAAGPGTSIVDILQWLLGGTGNNTNPAMLGGIFGLSSNGANILNIGGGNWASAASALLGMAGGGLLPAGSDTIGDAAAAAALASETTPVEAGVGGMAGMGGMPVAAMGQGTLVGNLSAPPAWAGGQVTPVVGTSVTPVQTVGWTGAAPQTGSVVPGMPGMVAGTGRASTGFGAPRYGVKPIVMPKSTAV